MSAVHAVHAAHGARAPPRGGSCRAAAGLPLRVACQTAQQCASPHLPPAEDGTDRFRLECFYDYEWLTGGQVGAGRGPALPPAAASCKKRGSSGHPAVGIHRALRLTTFHLTPASLPLPPPCPPCQVKCELETDPADPKTKQVVAAFACPIQKKKLQCPPTAQDDVPEALKQAVGDFLAAWPAGPRDPPPPADAS